MPQHGPNCFLGSKVSGKLGLDSRLARLGLATSSPVFLLKNMAPLFDPHTQATQVACSPTKKEIAA